MYKRILKDECIFWESVAEDFRKRRSIQEQRTFNNLFEKGFTEYVEKYLKELIDDLKTKGTVDTTLTLEQGTQFFAIAHCESISKDLRNELCSLVYPSFADKLVDDLKKGKINRNFSLREGMIMVRIVDSKLVEEDLRNELCSLVYPRIIRNLIDGIKTRTIGRDDITWGDLDRIMLLIDSNIDPELCSQLSTIIYGADEREK